MNDEGGGSHQGQDLAHIHRGDPRRSRGGLAGARGGPHRLREPAPEGGVFCLGWTSEGGHLLGPPGLGDEGLALQDRVERQSPRIVLHGGKARGPGEQDQRLGSFRLRRREQERDRRGLNVSEQSSASEPTASSTARVSSAESSHTGIPSRETGSDPPSPRLSNVMTRLKAASRRRKWA